MPPQQDQITAVLFLKGKEVFQTFGMIAYQHLPLKVPVQLIQLEIDDVLLGLKAAVEGLPGDICFMTDLGDGNGLEGLPLHEPEQGIGDHLLALESHGVGVFGVHRVSLSSFACIR